MSDATVIIQGRYIKLLLFVRFDNDEIILSSGQIAIQRINCPPINTFYPLFQQLDI